MSWHRFANRGGFCAAAALAEDKRHTALTHYRHATTMCDRCRCVFIPETIDDLRDKKGRAATQESTDQ